MRHYEGLGLPGGDGPSPLVLRNPSEDSPPVAAAVEIFMNEGLKKHGAVPLMVDGVDVMSELKRVRWFALTGYGIATFSTALAIAALVFIFLHHSS